MVNLAIWIPIGFVVAVILILVSYYNRFVSLLNRIENSLAQIDVQLKKRADLVPNLVEAVKGYMKHEKSVITEVTTARKAMIGAKDISGKVKAGDNLQSALGHLFAIAENYPNLKANENFLQLQTELSAIEDKVAYSRQYYNDSILSYNTATTMLPGKLFARIFGFKEKKDYLKITEKERVVPKLKFD